MDIDLYRRRVAALRSLDPDCQVFGALKHRWAFAEPASDAVIAEFERAHGVSLPTSYRAYLQRLGNGGAGPYYGVEPLAPWRAAGFSRVTATLTTSDGQTFSASTGERPEVPTSDPGRPCPLEGEWKLGDELPAKGNLFDGCVFLSEIGCGYQALLVLHGPEAGKVYEDYTAGDGSIRPVADDFGAWVQRHADVELAGLLVARIERLVLYPALEASAGDVVTPHLDVFDALFDESDPWSHIERAYAAVVRGDEASALATAERALGLADLDAKPGLARGVAVSRIGAGDAAGAHELLAPLLAQELAFQVRAALHEADAAALDALGHDSAGAWEAARAARPFELSLRLRLALAHLRAGRAKAADEVVTAAQGEMRLFDRGRTLEGNPKRRAVLEGLALLCEQAGRPEDAARYREAAAALPTGPTGWGNPGNTKSW